MHKLLVHIYGIIPGEFKEIELEVEKALTLEQLERELTRRFGSKIPELYKLDNGLLNHQQVISGDMQGKRIDYDMPDISQGGEIYFVVPIAGG